MEATLDLGIAALAEVIVADDLASGRLPRVLPEWQAAPIPVYAITETRLPPAKTQSFMERQIFGAELHLGQAASGRRRAGFPNDGICLVKDGPYAIDALF